MAQEIKDLIAKIQQEGIQEAQKQAAQIKTQAQDQASKIIAEAKIQAEKIIQEGVSQTKKLEDSTQAALGQAARDLLINLRQEINAMLERLIKQNLRQALSAEELAKIIAALVKSAPLTLGSQIIVSLNPADKDKLEQGFLKQLVGETKKSITLESTPGIASGFVISFDEGKSIFDFSNQALSDYLGGYLKPGLAKILSP